MAVTGALIGAVGSAIAGGVATSAILLGAGLGAIYDYVIESSVEDAMADTMGGRMASGRDPVASRKVIYGTVRTGGTPIYIETSGNSNEFLHQVTAFAGHEITSFRDIYYDGVKAASFTGDGSPDRTNLRYYNDWSSNSDGSESTTAKYTLINAENGTTTQTSLGGVYAEDDLTLDNRMPTRWSADYKCLGIAVMYNRFLATSDNPYTKLPNVTAEIEGAKLYDPRQDSSSSVYDSNVGTGHDFDDRTTYEFSNNPALCVFDYLTNTTYGAGIPRTMIDYTSLAASADYCDELITLADNSQIKRYLCDGVIDTQSSLRNNVAALLSSMNGRIAFSGGKFHIDAYMYRTPQTTIIDESMIISPITIKTKLGKKDSFNSVKGQFMSADDNYKLSAFPVQRSQTYIDDDGELLEHEMKLSMTTNHNHAQILAQLTLLKSRMQTTLRTELNIEGLRFRVGDNVKFANETIGYSSADPKIFEITRLQIKPSKTQGITVSIEARETAEAIYNYDSSTALSYTSGTNLEIFDPIAVTAPTTVTAMPFYTSGSGQFGRPEPKAGLSLSWDGQTGAVAGFNIIIRRADSDEQVRNAVSNDNKIDFTELESDTEYDFEIYSLNARNDKSPTAKEVTFTTPNIGSLGTGETYRFITDSLSPPSATNFLDYFGKHAVAGDQVVVIVEDANGIVTDSATYVYRPELYMYQTPAHDPTGTAFVSYTRDSRVTALDAFFNAGLRTGVEDEVVTFTIQGTSNFQCSDPSITAFTNLSIGSVVGSDNRCTLNAVVTKAQANARVKEPYAYNFILDTYYEFGDVTVRAAWDNQYVEKVFKVAVAYYGFS